MKIYKSWVKKYDLPPANFSATNNPNQSTSKHLVRDKIYKYFLLPTQNSYSDRCSRTHGQHNGNQSLKFHPKGLPIFFPGGPKNNKEKKDEHSNA